MKNTILFGLLGAILLVGGKIPEVMGAPVLGNSSENEVRGVEVIKTIQKTKVAKESKEIKSILRKIERLERQIEKLKKLIRALE